MGGGGRWRVGLLVLLLTAVAWGQAPKPEAEAYKMQWPGLQQALADGDLAAVQAGVEAYLKDYPNDSYYQRRVVGLMGAVFSDRRVWGTPLHAQIADDIMERFADVPNYYALAASRRAYGHLFPFERAELNPAQGEIVASGAIETLGDRLSPELIYARQLLSYKLVALYATGRHQEALAWAKTAAETAPLLLQDRVFLRWVAMSAKFGDQPELYLPAARLYYALCEYDEKWINEGIEQANEALSAIGGPGLALQFAKSQETVGQTNALVTAEMLDLGDPSVMLTAAGENLDAQIDVHLYSGDIAKAVELSKQQMRESQGQPALLAIALKNLARCFKAADCSVARANQFLTFHATGEGENPLADFEAELAAKTPGAAP